jgi:hypothetical protein
MKRAIWVLAAAIAGCTVPAATTPSSSPLASVVATGAPTPVPTGSTTMKGLADTDIAAAVALLTPAASDLIVYTAETDTNSLLGRPGQYTGKVSWTDPRAPQQRLNATIELFADDATLQARFAYLDPILKSSPLFLQYMYRNDGRRLLLRVPKELTPAQAQSYADWLRKL